MIRRSKHRETVDKQLPDFGKKAKEMRYEKLWTKGEMARRTGLTKDTITNLEEGRHMPSIDTLALIANALDMPIKNWFE